MNEIKIVSFKPTRRIFSFSSDWESSWTSSQLEEGDYIMSVTATDAAGNEAVFNHRFTVDSTQPTIANFR